MKKFLIFFVSILSVCSIGFSETNFGAKGASSINLTDAPDVKRKTKINYRKYETRSSGISNYNSDTKDIEYYSEPLANRRNNLYKEYDDSRSYRERSRIYSSSNDSSRKYYLSHPFFQPLKGQFGSVTDISFGQSSYSFDMINGVGALANEKANWKAEHVGVKEDISFGLSDSFSLLGMLKYNYSNYSLDWTVNGNDKNSNTGINLFGIGGQWRFLDDSQWIGTIAGYYQKQKDMFDSFTADLKIGSKMKTSTFYALARGSFLNFEKDSYGDGLYDKTTDQLFFLAYKTGIKNVSFLEAGLGLFSVLDESLTLNLEGVFGNYDWHNQANLKASIGWQSSKYFSLNFYGVTSVYDSANGMNLETHGYRAGAYLGPQGKANIKDHREFSLGAQFIFLF